MGPSTPQYQSLKLGTNAFGLSEMSRAQNEDPVQWLSMAGTEAQADTKQDYTSLQTYQNVVDLLIK